MALRASSILVTEAVRKKECGRRLAWEYVLNYRNISKNILGIYWEYVLNLRNILGVFWEYVLNYRNISRNMLRIYWEYVLNYRNIGFRIGLELAVTSQCWVYQTCEHCNHSLSIENEIINHSTVFNKRKMQSRIHKELPNQFSKLFSIADCTCTTVEGWIFDGGE